MTSIPPLPKASKGGRPFSLENADHERLLTMIIALAAEVSTLHDKLDNLTQVAGRDAPFSAADVEAYQPEPAEAEARARRRQAFVGRVLRIIQADFERAQTTDDMAYDDILAMVAKEPERA
ncbi:hypothetical protein [Brevundimonas faecalis]|uniref:Uncharacterized protein n=1 Tax=Brevundimonas faecalis TaxID=947378 RepID=A0ABV2R9V3_9CAUL